MTRTQQGFSFWPTDATAPSIAKSSVSSLDMATKKAPKPLASFKPHRLLYPMKEYHQEDESATEQGGKLFCGAETKWVGLTPLDMIQTIISLAEKSSGFRDGLLHSSLRAFLVDEENPPVEDADAGQKRKLESHGEDMEVLESSDEYAGALVETCSSMKLLDGSFKSWGIFPATDQLLRLGTLAKDFEGLVAADSKKQWSIPSYNRVQQAFASHGDAAIATSQMKALVALVSSVEARKTNPAPLAVPPPQVVPPAISSAASALLALEKSAAKKPPEATVAKQDVFQECMNLWIKTNFSNPFPDETMVNRLAHYLIFQVPCIAVNEHDIKVAGPADYHRIVMDVAIDKVQNWLMNARSRKWRPSITKAFDGKRPAALLLEDSIRIYEGVPLRPLNAYWNGDALLAFDPLYSVPLKSWKKHRAEGKQSEGKQTKARKVSTSPHVLNSTMRPRLSPYMLNNATQPPALDISPICAQVDQMAVAEDANTFGGASPICSHVDDMLTAGGIVEV